MYDPETRTESQLRQIKWLLAAIFACLAIIAVAMLPAMIKSLATITGVVIVVLGLAGLVYAAWLLVSYLFDRVQKRQRAKRRASTE